MELRTERLIIEPLRADRVHVEGWYEALRDPRVSAYFEEPDVTTPEALNTRIGHLLDGPGDSHPGQQWMNWIVRLADHPAQPVIGRLEATVYDGAWGEIAYLFDPRHWGHGYAVEGGTWMVEHLAAEGVGELWACVSPANAASVRLTERLGLVAVDGPPAKGLGSYDETDDVFVRTAAPADLAIIAAPQWQGAGAKGRPIGAGCGALIERLRLAPMASLPHDDALDDEPVDGIVGRSQLAASFERIAAVLPTDMARTLVVGGDCATDIVPITSAVRRFGEGLRVVYFDAHTDANSPATSPSGALHGMVLQHITGSGDPAITATLPALVDPSQIVQAGVRDADPGEADWVAEVGLAQIAAADIGTGMEEHHAVHDATALYVHLDLDVLDPTEFPHTTYPVADGPSVAQVTEALRALVSTGKVVGMAITESIATADQLAAIEPILRIVRTWALAV